MSNGPPLPDIQPITNGVSHHESDHEDDVNSEDEVKPHSVSSVSRTNPLVTRMSQESLANIKQKMDFSEPLGDTTNTDSNVTDHPPVKPDISVSLCSTSSAPPTLHWDAPNNNNNDNNLITDDSEATATRGNEIDNSASVSLILSRIDVVRSYIADAQQLYEKLQESLNDGVESEDQLRRISVLIHQLKQQELSYLQVLLKIMEDGPDNDDESDDNEDDDDDDGDDDHSSTHSDHGGNESMSLREAMSEDQQSELSALQEQRELLQKLIEQQKQMEILEARQLELLSLKKDAEDKLAMIEKKTTEFGDAMCDGNDDGYSAVSSNGLLTGEVIPKSTTDNSNQTQNVNGGAVANGDSIAQETDTQATSECVHDLDEFQAKLKQFEEAKQRLASLQSTLSDLQSVNNVGPSHPVEIPSLTANNDDDDDDDDDDEPQANIQPSNDNDEFSELLSEYELNIHQKQKELDMLKAQRSELKQVEEMLQNLQLLTEEAKMSSSLQTGRNNPGVGQQQPAGSDNYNVQSKLEQQLDHQRELYTTLMKKTSQLQQLQQDIERLSRGSDHDSGGMVDTTAATWGGSSRVSDDDCLNITKESTGSGGVNYDSNDDNSGGVNYRVDRHTPRISRPLRRAYSPHNDESETTEKKIKLEPPPVKSGAGGGRNSTQTAATPTTKAPVQPRSAIWPGVIFPDKVSSHQKQPQKHLPSYKYQKEEEVSGDRDEYVNLLQAQLRHSTEMNRQLMDHQSGLLSALHQRLDVLPYIQDQLLQLHQYHNYLQGYNEYLNNVYSQLNKESGDEQPLEEDGLNDSLSKPLPVPKLTPISFGIINSPYQRPPNPHLSSSVPPANLSLLNVNDLDDDVTGSPAIATFPGGISNNSHTTFHDLSDTIYNEVASLIDSNEDRPHYLIELFSGLQLLNTDYLRQRALYAIQEIVGKYMTDDKATQPTSNKSYELKLEDIESDSSLSTPPASETPFALNTLGDTIIKIEDPITPLKTGDSSDDTFISVLLDDKIKSIMSQVIALLKSFLNEECTESVIRDILQNVMSIVMSKENIKDNHLEKLFEKQLRLCLNAVIRKYGGQRLCDIGEDLLVDITEVLFNELSCYQLLKDEGNMICSPLKVEDVSDDVIESPVIVHEDEETSLENARDDELVLSWDPPTVIDEKNGSDDKGNNTGSGGTSHDNETTQTVNVDSDNVCENTPVELNNGDIES